MNLELSKNPQAAMQEMMQVIDTLRDVYRRETEAIENLNTAMFLELQAEKLKAADAYQDGIKQISARKEEMKAVGPAFRLRLEEKRKEFQVMGEKNLEALRRMGLVTNHLGNTIRNAASKAAVRERAFSYGENGALNSAGKRPISTGLSETA